MTNDASRFALAIRHLHLRWPLVIVAVYVVARQSLVEPFRIPSGSMSPLLVPGDFVVIDKFSFGLRLPGIQSRYAAIRSIRDGDIVVFDSPDGAEPAYIKRVVGTPGDTVGMYDKVLYRNSKEVLEPYGLTSSDQVSVPTDFLWQRDYLVSSVDATTYDPSAYAWGPIVVPAHSYFVLGDNRGRSFDSREWGFVDIRHIQGRALFVYASIAPDTLLPWYSVRLRWNRIGIRLY